MRHRRFTFASAAPFALLLGCGSGGPAPDVLATFNGGAVRVAEVDQLLLTLPSAQRQPQDGQDLTTWLEGKVELLFERAAVATPEALRALEGDAEFTAMWTKRTQNLAAAVYLRHHNERFDVTVEEARQHFMEQPERFGQAERRSFRNLLLAASSPAELDAACKRAEELRTRAVAGESFEELIRQFSQSSNAASGGLVGVMRRDQLRGEIGDLLFTLEPGTLSPVVKNRAGCQLFRVEQIVPATAPTFEMVREKIISELAEERRREIFHRLLTAEAELRGAPLPAWLGAGPPPDLPLDSVLFELGGERLIAREVLAQQAPAAELGERVRSRIAEILFAFAARRDFPAEVEAAAGAERATAAADFLRRRAILRFIGERPEGELRRFYEERKASYVSEPRLELAVYSWPIEPGDPLDSLTRPEAFVAALRAPGADAAAVWATFARDRGALSQELPQMTLRQVVEAAPQLTGLVVGELAEGQVLGPARAGKRLWVARVTLYVPSRQLGFIEVRDQLRRELLTERGPASWLAEIKHQRSYTLHPENLRRFGDTLLARIQAAP